MLILPNLNTVRPHAFIDIVAASGVKADGNGKWHCNWLVVSGNFFFDWTQIVSILNTTSHDEARRIGVDLPAGLSINASSKIVDDGRGNALVCNCNKLHLSCLHWFWVNATTHSVQVPYEEGCCCLVTTWLTISTASTLTLTTYCYTSANLDVLMYLSW